MKEKKELFVENRVDKYYFEDDVNCAVATLRILGERFGISIGGRMEQAVTGFPGAGRYGAQCGLVGGTLLFIGLHGHENTLDEEAIRKTCRRFAAGFEKKFGSLSCAVLRPEGFRTGQPPHMCRDLTCRSAKFCIDFMERSVKEAA